MQYNFWSDPGRKLDVELVVPPHKFSDFEELVKKFGLKTEIYVDNIQR